MQDDDLTPGLGRQPHRQGRRAVVEGVLDQHHQALGEPLGVAGGQRQRRVLRGGLQTQASLGTGGEALEGVEQHILGVDRLAAQMQAAGILAGQIEHVAHHGAHALGLGGDQGQGGSQGGHGVLALQALGMAGDQGDRRAQFMGHPIDEGALALPGGSEALLHGVEGGGDRPQLIRLGVHLQRRRRIGQGAIGRQLIAEDAQGPCQAETQHQAQQQAGEQGGHTGGGRQKLQ